MIRTRTATPEYRQGFDETFGAPHVCGDCRYHDHVRKWCRSFDEQAASMDAPCARAKSMDVQEMTEPELVEHALIRAFTPDPHGDGGAMLHEVMDGLAACESRKAKP